MSSTERPSPASLWRRMVAGLHGEVSAAHLEALVSAGGGVYEQYLDSERSRAQLAAQGTHPWEASRAIRMGLLSTWNAHVLHSLGATLLEADYDAEPSTQGFVPPVTAQQALLWLSAVEPWLATVRQAELGDVLAAGSLPADLPAWVEVEPCPPAHLSAMLSVAERLDNLLEASMATVSSLTGDETTAQRLLKVQQMAVVAHTALEYCQRLGSARPDQRLHELIEQRLHRTLEVQFHLGQLLADPRLIDTYVPDTQPASSTPTLALDPADPWCLTDPRSREQWQRDPKARNAVAQLWRYDPDPELTRALAMQVADALHAGQVRYAKDPQGTAFGNYYCCPWSAIYEVRSPVRVLGRKLQPGDQFTLDVSAEEIPETGQFVRRIVTGPFSPTSKVDYCDPTSGAHHDD